jgi:hypothetical protein
LESTAKEAETMQTHLSTQGPRIVNARGIRRRRLTPQQSDDLAAACIVGAVQLRPLTWGAALAAVPGATAVGTRLAVRARRGRDGENGGRSGENGGCNGRNGHARAPLTPEALAAELIAQVGVTAAAELLARANNNDLNGNNGD